MDVVRFLIYSGANIEAVEKGGETALMYAAAQAEPATAKALIKHGADVSVQDHAAGITSREIDWFLKDQIALLACSVASSSQRKSALVRRPTFIRPFSDSGSATCARIKCVWAATNCGPMLVGKVKRTGPERRGEVD